MAEDKKEVADTPIPVATPTLKEVNEVAERLEKANAEKSILLDREEKLLAQQRMAGMSGTSRVEQPKVETAKEYADRIMRNQTK
jgi:hypothetical protein